MTYIETILTIIALCSMTQIFITMPEFLNNYRLKKATDRLLKGVEWNDELEDE